MGIKIFAPASVANLACGFDIIGLALEKPGDEIIVNKSETKGLKITKITGTKKNLPYEIEKNTAGVAAMSFLKHIGEENAGIELEIHKKMPFGSGLGSSAASAAAAVVAVNEILRLGFDKRDLLRFAVLGEQAADGAFHADNVAPSLLGGIQFIRDSETLDVYRLPSPPGLHVVVVYPHISILTKDARSILSKEVSLENHIKQSSNLAGLIIGLQRADLELIQNSLTDHIIEHQRAPLIPHFYEVKEAALNLGILGCSISGAGPSIFALCQNSAIADEVGAAMNAVFSRHKINSDVYVSKVNQEGTIVL